MLVKYLERKHLKLSLKWTEKEEEIEINFSIEKPDDGCETWYLCVSVYWRRAFSYPPCLVPKALWLLKEKIQAMQKIYYFFVNTNVSSGFASKSNLFKNNTLEFTLIRLVMVVQSKQFKNIWRPWSQRLRVFTSAPTNINRMGEWIST